MKKNRNIILSIFCLICSIQTGGDILNNLQKKIGLTLPGTTIGIPTGFKPTHTIDDFLKHKLPEP